VATPIARSTPAAGTPGGDAGFSALVEEGRVSGRAYRDPAVFDAEMQRIFGRTWVFVGHESEIAEPGDYKTTTIGVTPVIVSRDDDGAVRVLLNRCRHRAATVCQEGRGNARFFRCAYHRWTYANDGRLTGVPFPSGYAEDFDRSAYGLLSAPRVATYRGLIFASLAAEGRTLEEHLGPVMGLIDEVCDVSPQGEIKLGAGRHRFEYEGNWKLQMDNGIDGYHPALVHESFAEAMAESISGDRVKADLRAIYSDKSPAVCRDLGNGHAMLDQRVFAPMGIDERSGGGFMVVIFPNLMLFGAQIRTILPRAWDRTEVTVDVITYPGMEDLTEGRLRTHEMFFGPAGFGQPDDTEMFERIWAGLRAGAGGAHDWVDISRGMHRETVEDGLLTANITDEAGQRSFYGEWTELMAEVRS
jgi:phenylpropionate dioxygenase-like ring-hydroxylating dioxygenase large terminal subunit